MQALSTAPLSGKAFAARRSSGFRAAQKSRVTVAAVAVDTSRLSAEQLAFLERKRSQSSSPAPAAASRGRSSAPSAGGLSAEQQAFLQRKARESSSSPAAPARGRSGSSRPSARPSSRPAPVAAPSYSAPAASYSAPSANGLSAEQKAFLDRKAREGSSSPAAPTRGRSGSARPSARPSSRPAPAPAASYSPPAASYSAPSANGLSAEQKAFLDRKARERSASPAPTPARGRSGSARPSSRAPTPAPARSASYSPPPASYSAPSSGGLSAEQQAFLDRKRSTSPAPAAPARGRSGSSRPSARPSSRPASSAPSYSAPSSGGLSAEQQAFLDRKRSSSPAPAAPARGRSGSSRPSARPSSRPSSSYSPPAASYSAPAASSSSYRFVTPDEQRKLSKEQVSSLPVGCQLLQSRLRCSLAALDGRADRRLRVHHCLPPGHAALVSTRPPVLLAPACAVRLPGAQARREQGLVNSLSPWPASRGPGQRRSRPPRLHQPVPPAA
ncbi:hypothetical protein ABPG77_006254 [Micractinium sp. CCAP 211/92]